MILANPDLPDRDSCILERAMKMCLLFEHSVRARWNASHVEARPQKSIGWRAWFLSKLKASEGPVRLSNQLPEWLASILSSVSEINGLQSNNENDCIARLSLLLGTCRGFTTSKAPAGSENRLAEPKDLMETLIASLTEQLAVSLGICSLNSPLSYQVMVSLSASQIFSAKPIQDFQGLPYDFKLLLKVCLNVLLFHPQALATDNSPEADRLLQGDIAGLSRLCGGLAALCWAAGDGKSVAEAAECLANFSCGVQGLLNARVQSGNIPNTAPQTTRTSPSFFNLALFGVTMVVQQIIETIVDVPVDFEDSIEDTWTATAVAELDIISSALRSLSYLHGITLNFGFDGFKAWRDVLDACTERLVLLTSDDSEKAVPPVSKILLLLLPLYKDEFVSSSEKDKSELLFALQVTRRLFRHIPPQTMENEVFPRLFPYFTYNLPKDLAKETWKPSNSDSDLLEFSHELAVSLFKNVHKFRDFVTAFSPWYTETLVSVRIMTAIAV
ncbi:hypothetical protein DFJ73DRAFT_522639 [Zopfochytrium polystomum]|nr:hypothetical protein DFJ73DRAFT_522639 [Zopfochytrium polystomum]